MIADLYKSPPVRWLRSTDDLIDLGWREAARVALGCRPSEARLLQHLIDHAGGYVSYADLYTRLPHSGERVANDRHDAVRSRVVCLRKQLDDVGLGGVIKTAVGEGYGMERPDAERVWRWVCESVGREAAGSREVA